jgi:DNA-binding NarL/FixJ family response regulator
MIRVILVDDHDMVRSALARVLSADSGFTVVGEAAKADQAWELYLKHRPEVVVCDLDLPGISGRDFALRVLERNPQQGVVILSYRIEPSEVQFLVEAGVRGYVTKSCASEELTLAIRNVAGGGHHWSPEASSALAISMRKQAGEPLNPLSPRQTLILHHMARGLTTREIAEEMCLSPKTVEKYRGEVLRRLDCKNQVQAIDTARRRKILDPT